MTNSASPNTGSAGRMGKRHGRFFPVTASLMALIVFVGFSSTFYLRPITGAEGSVGTGPLPMQVVLHGVIFTTWMVVFLSQTWLIASHRVDLHMTVGRAGAVLAGAVVASGTATTILFVPRAVAAGLAARQVTAIFVLDITSLIWFAAFAGLALAWRGNPATHKRLMYFAVLSILGQALGGMNRPIGTVLGQFVPAPLGVLGAGIFVVALVIHDYIGDGRVRKATIWGGCAILARFGIVGGLSVNEVVQSAVLSLS